MSIPVVLWVVIAVALAIVYVYRKIVESSTDELVHVSDPDDAIIAKQARTAQTVQQLDRVVMLLAVLFIIYGIALGGLQVYQAMNSPGGAA